MNKRILLALSVALWCGATARAGTPLPPQILAEVDAILSSCVDIDGQDREKFRALQKSLTAGETDRQLAAVEKTPLFRETLKAVKDVVHGMPHGDALELCLATINQANKPTPHGDGRDRDNRPGGEHRDGR
jgi:hypothetical protein